jgi:hypothetical protein
MAERKTTNVSVWLYPIERQKLDEIADQTNLGYAEIIRRLIRAGTVEMVLAQPRQRRMGRPRLTEKLAERLAEEEAHK